MNTPKISSNSHAIYLATAFALGLSLFTAFPWIGALIGGLVGLGVAYILGSSHIFICFFTGWMVGNFFGFVIGSRSIVRRISNSD